jgi:hypothetical protein
MWLKSPDGVSATNGAGLVYYTPIASISGVRNFQCATHPPWGGRLPLCLASEGIVAIKLLLEIIGATVAVVCLAIAVKALVELRSMSRAEEHERRTMAHKETERGMRRAS